MKIKSIIAAAALAAAAVSANADTYALPINDASTFDVNGAFEDYLTFSISTPSSFSWGATNVPYTFSFDVPNGKKITTITINSNISGLTSSLFSGTPSSSSAISSGTLAIGDYFIKVSGTGVGTNGLGTYAVASSVVAVPEPESYAMFLAGLGIMGMVARRRFAKG